MLNKALHGKWALRYWNDNNSLWKRVVDCKRNLNGRQNQILLERSKYGVSLWKGISYINSSVLECSRWNVVKGNKIKFSSDLWCRNSNLQSQFPHIYALSKDKHMIIEEAFDKK